MGWDAYIQPPLGCVYSIHAAHTTTTYGSRHSAYYYYCVLHTQPTTHSHLSGGQWAYSVL